MNPQTTIITHEEEIPVKGNAVVSGDDAFDREVEEEIETRLARGDVWAWCTVEVRVTCLDCGEHASDFLGACSYEDYEAFRNDDYFTDMQHAATSNLKHACTCKKADA